MAEETRRQTEEAGTASEEIRDEAQACAETEAETARDEAENAAGTPSEDTPQESAEAGDPESEEAAPQEDAEGAAQEDDIVDGDYVSAEDAGKKSSFFRRKKDKKDEKIEELTDQVKRQMAEFDNFRKRSEKEKGQMFDFGAKSVIEKILPVIDNFERGLQQAGENPEDPFVQGMEKIYKQMFTELESIGVKPIEAEGKQFDPNLHNAVMHCEDESVGENIVVQELQKGYLYHDTVVRHSMVKVAN